MTAVSAMAAFSGELADLIERLMPNVVALRGDGPDGSWVAGSGFVVDGARHVVTNNHVVAVEGEFEFSAAMHGYPTQPVRILGRDPLTDLAVVELSEPHEASLTLRTTPARIGEFCLAMGNPLGEYPESVSVGIISGLSRQTLAADGARPLQRMIQTDAAINHGNSGGPLVDLNGEVVGVNTCVMQGDGIQGMGFAIPAQTVERIVAMLIADGRVARATLGVSVHDRDIEVEGKTGKREVVTKVNDKDGPFRVGDVLLSVNGVDVDGHAALFDVLGAELIGHKTLVEVLRDGARTELDIVPERLPG
jgi:S1-C subfamily serine protease